MLADHYIMEAKDMYTKTDTAICSNAIDDLTSLF